ncbi:flagellar hook-basal body complex protein FliE [Aliiglaciecola lipolytica]|uniref:Flagellar hook-basal body complex protein FliE n=1 Tax=Aliiglaciecola lipolytica E3 TaxID=1127673 RepID=K6YVE0_9ALTE|nr:flagellar hook-basal body complex protein FliE [Aliiglaciecola lipolytica]GAC15225.1 flagellar hook-basal body complex protein FliE [Aliiglaciecola lipolytica E3]
MEIKAQSLYQEMQAMAAGAQMDIAPLAQQSNLNPSSQNFAEMLGQAINTVNDMQLDAKDQQIKFEMGDPNMSLADVMLAKEKSGIAFEATVQVRNKVMEAYKQIMNMPV